MLALPLEEQPEWMKGRTQSNIHQIFLESVQEAINTALYVQKYMDAEVRKGRSYEEALEEMRPAIEKTSDPVQTIDQECNAAGKPYAAITDAGDASVMEVQKSQSNSEVEALLKTL